MNDDDDDDNFKNESVQPVSYTFCEPVPELSRKLQLEHHQCIRLLKAVYGLVNAPRRWYHRVATDLRNMKGSHGTLLVDFRDENGLCLVYVDDFMLACRDSPFGKHVFESINNLYEWDNLGFTGVHSAAHESHKPTKKYNRSVSEKTRKKFRSSTYHHIHAETENPKSLHLICLNFEL